jgi:hypothetical protein
LFALVSPCCFLLCPFFAFMSPVSFLCPFFAFVCALFLLSSHFFAFISQAVTRDPTALSRRRFNTLKRWTTLRTGARSQLGNRRVRVRFEAIK